MLSENFTIDDRKYNFDYKEQTNRTIIVISSQTWDEQGPETMTEFRELFAQRVSVSSTPSLPPIFFSKNQPDGNSSAVLIEELGLSRPAGNPFQRA